MPFRSESQRRWMFSNHPEMARRWAAHTPPGKLPEKVSGIEDDPERFEQSTKLSYVLQGHTEVQGIPVSIENRKGSVRKGTDKDGHEWRTKMKHPYGYITGTKGADNEPVDAYVGPDKEAPNAYVVHQNSPETGKYDEDKVMLGFRSKREAKEAFLKHYDKPGFLGPIMEITVDRLKELIESKAKLVKIAACLDELGRIKCGGL